MKSKQKNDPDSDAIDLVRPLASLVLPCPFCGNQPQYLATTSMSSPEIIVHRLLCCSGACGVQPFSGWHLSAEEAAEVWNERKPANPDMDTRHGSKPNP